MNSDWKRRFTWIDLSEVGSVFHKEPFPKRGHRGDLGPLRLSIARCGVINPIIVRVKEGKLQVVCGYRRWLAAQVAGIEEIPAVVTNLNDEDATQLFSEEASFRDVEGHEDNDGQDERDESLETAGSVQPTEPSGERVRTTDVIESESDASRSTMTVQDRDASGPGIDRSVSQLYEMTREVFRETHATWRVPMKLVHDLTEKLSVLEPVKKGVDIREVGVARLDDQNPAEACDFLAAHGLRVAMLAQAFGLSCEWSGRKILQIIRAGLTHDVGMLFVPTEWFDSSFPLTRERQLAIQKHTEIGQQVIAKSGEPLADVAVVARDHHERCDGTGYPAGKKGTALGEFPQIIGLIDSYAAMVSTRSYRQPYLLGEALNVLREAGRVGIFHSELVQTFFNVVSSWPFGACGRLADGAVMRVRGVDRESAKTHLIGVIESGTRFRKGEELWLRESELPSMATEIALPETAPTVEVESDVAVLK